MTATVTSTPTQSEIQYAMDIINAAFASPRESWNADTEKTIHHTISLLDSGALRVSHHINDTWQHNGWLQKAILCYFKLTHNHINQNAFLHYNDKIDSKFSHTPIDQLACRVVPPTHVRYGAHIGAQCVLMPSFINIGAYIDDHSMIDTWATIGSCAQIGKHVHISGGVGIGGVLEPVQATPTIIEDHCFIGARSEIAEGVLVKKGAVIAMGTFISQSTKIFDRSNGTISYGVIPENAVVVPGSLPSKDGSHQLNAAIIVKYADLKTRSKTGINDILRDF